MEVQKKMTKPKKNVVVHEGTEYEVRYVHQRRYNEEKNEVLPNGGVTQAYIALEKDDAGKPTKIIDEIADCDPLDAFSKHLGAKIALGRLKRRLSDPKWAEARNVRRGDNVDKLLSPQPGA